MNLTRRRFGVLLMSSAVGASGCLGDGDENGDGNGDGNSDGESDDGNDDNGEGDGNRNGDEPGTTEFRGHELSPLPASENNVWYHDRGDAPVYLEPSDETVEPPQDVVFTLRNESDDGVGMNPYDWNVYKLYEGDWRLVMFREIPEPWETLPSGESESQTVSVGTEASGDTDIALGDGIYGFYLGTRDYATAFEVVEAEVVVEPSDTVTRTERDGGSLTVYTKQYEDAGDSQTETLVFRRGDALDRPTPYDMPTVLREQAANEEVLRNTLPYFDEDDEDENGGEEVNEVRLKTSTAYRGNLGAFLGGGVTDSERWFVYEGDEYSVELVE